MPVPQTKRKSYIKRLRARMVARWWRGRDSNLLLLITITKISFLLVQVKELTAEC
jgi:hypothetical protein